MDVEQVQKINNLALELMKKGLAADRETAVAMAEETFHSNNTEGYNSMRETMEKVNTEVQPERKMEKSDQLTNEKVTQILEQNTQFIVKKMQEFQEKIKSLEKEVDDLRTRVHSQRIPTVKEIIAQAEAVKENSSGEVSRVAEEQGVPPANPSPEANPQPVKEKSAAPNHPRSGDYEEDDVSIEKFFYMGSK